MMGDFDHMIDMGDPGLDAVWAYWRAVAPAVARLAEEGIAAIRSLRAPASGAVHDFGRPPPRRDYRTLRRRRKLRYVMRRR